MAFVYDPKTYSAYDRDNDFYIVFKPTMFREAEDQDHVTFMLRYHGEEDYFDIVSINTPSQNGYRPSYAKDYVFSEENNAKAGSTITFILENTVRIPPAIRKKLKNPFSIEIEYQKIRDLLKEGLYTIKTAGGKNFQEFPGKNYQVEFEKNIATVAAKYPGKLKKYENWARAYNIVQQD